MNNVMDMIRSLGPMRLGIIGGAALAVIIGIAVLASSASSPPLSPLYSNLDQGDVSAIATELGTMGVTFEVDPAGTTISIPEEQVLQTRMRLAELGLPSAGGIGYEIFDQGDRLGVTNFTQQINRLRALEGELARTIRSLDIVQQARVHLVLPERELFSRAEREPSASIVVQLRGGRVSDDSIAAMRNLVAAAVPELRPSRISIVDDRGNMLARPIIDEEGAANDRQSQNEQFRLRYERRLQQDLEDMLERVVGIGNARVQVQADMTFDRITTNSEVFDPDQQVVRSTQTIDEAEQSENTEQDEPVTVGNEIPDAALNPAEGGGGNRSTSSATRTEETTNFEISRRVEVQETDGGRIQNLSIGVLVNHAFTLDENGERQFAPRPQEELDQIAELISSAAGVNAQRGDTLEVINLQFATVEESFEVTDDLGLLGLTRDDIMQLAEMVVLGIVAILTVLLVLRPLVARIIAMGEEAQEAAAQMPGGPTAIPGSAEVAALSMPDADGDDLEAMIDLDKVEGRVKASSVKRIGEIIDKHPEEAVAILRSWLYETA